MHYVICVPDGAADEPIAALGGQTPLEAAAMPHLAALAARGHVGRAATIPPGFPAGSDVGNLSILGYDPARYHTGRAPIEAAAMGLRLEPDQVAYRCNLATVTDDGTMADFAGGHPTSEAAAEVIAALQGELGGDGISFHAGVQYRHIMV
ncbi:MAG: cofactor-independent phosphoglycerate mutase, partial [Acidimicrobiales bacterium]